LPETDTLRVKSDDFIEIDSFGDFIVEGFFDEVRIIAEDFYIDHKSRERI
jgi:hypothetical protein